MPWIAYTKCIHKPQPLMYRYVAHSFSCIRIDDYNYKFWIPLLLPSLRRGKKIVNCYQKILRWCTSDECVCGLCIIWLHTCIQLWPYQFPFYKHKVHNIWECMTGIHLGYMVENFENFHIFSNKQKQKTTKNQKFTFRF